VCEGGGVHARSHAWLVPPGCVQGKPDQAMDVLRSGLSVAGDMTFDGARYDQGRAMVSTTHRSPVTVSEDYCFVLLMPHPTDTV